MTKVVNRASSIFCSSTWAWCTNRHTFSFDRINLFSNSLCRSYRLKLQVTSDRSICLTSKQYQKFSSKTMVAPESSQVWRVVVTRKLPPEAMNLLTSTQTSMELDVWDSDDPMPAEELISKLSKGTDALYCVLTDNITSQVLDAAGSRLKVVATMSVGYNHIDVTECKNRGILVSNTPNVLTETTADTAVGLVLATCRRFKEATASVVDGTWGTWEVMGMCGPDVHSSTVGVIGLGRIGAAVARRLRAFNCRILYTDQGPMPEIADPLGAEFASMDDLLKEADIVISLCPLTEETKGLFNKDKFKIMKNTAVFINPARGELVNQDDLLIALTEGQIYAAGLDVTVPEPIPTSHPLVKCPNCFILPHIGSASKGTRTAMACLASQNIVAAYKGESLPTQVKI